MCLEVGSAWQGFKWGTQVKRMVENLYESSGLLAVRKEGDFTAGFHFVNPLFHARTHCHLPIFSSAGESDVVH